MFQPPPKVRLRFSVKAKTAIARAGAVQFGFAKTLGRPSTRICASNPSRMARCAAMTAASKAASLLRYSVRGFFRRAGPSPSPRRAAFASVGRRWIFEVRRRLEFVLACVHFGAPFFIVGVIDEIDRRRLHRHIAFADTEKTANTDDVGFDVAVLERDVLYGADIFIGRIIDVEADGARSQFVAGRNIGEFTVAGGLRILAIILAAWADFDDFSRPKSGRAASPPDFRTCPWPAQ